MPDNDSLLYSYQKRALANSAERTLITLERSQKLDLLIHLLTNLRQALIVCGPEGIGKTTLLQTFEASRKDQWQICLMQGSSSSSFETVILTLSRFLTLSDSGYGFDLSSLRAYCEKQRVVLVIDDAGELVPGLIGELIDFAESLTELRLVFSMTYDEFHIKSVSDKALDDCHFIELPPLSLKQCTEYLQNLSAQPGALVAFSAVTDNLVEELYRDTHGIPGRILAEIPKLNQYKSRKKIRPGLWVGVALISVAALWIMLTLSPLGFIVDAGKSNASETVETKTVSQSPSGGGETLKSPIRTSKSEVRKESKENTALSAKSEELKIAVNKPAIPSWSIANPNKSFDEIETFTTDLLSLKPPIKQPEPPSVTAAKIEVQTVVTQTSADTPPKTVEPQIKKPSEAAKQKPLTGGNQSWIMEQPAENFTLQVMVLSTKDGADRFLKKFAQYSDSLRYFKVVNNTEEKYVLIYGSFKSIDEARKRKASMPQEFNGAVEKKFKSIQKR